MSDKFPHLRDNDYPHFDDAEPYKDNPSFDYSDYDYTIAIKLCRVAWDATYRHVVGWDSAQDRDAYFSALEGETIELDSGTVHVDYQMLRVEVPEDTCKRYNYVWIDARSLTPDTTLRHERADGVRKVGAFIMATRYLASSTTELNISVDVWTTYLPNKRISSCMLARGHAPMYSLDADDYLADPIGTCENLLTPDVNFGGYDVVHSGEFVPLYTSTPLIIVASCIPYSAINGISRAGSASSSAASFYDIDARNGHQVGVNGYVWAGNGRTYSGMNIPSNTLHMVSNSASQWLYAIESTAALDVIADVLPVFIKSAAAAFLVPSDLVTLGAAHAIGSVSVREVSISTALSELRTFTLEKSDFGYPAKYADIAKLYTMPYAHVELSDDLGQTVEIAIEETDGTISVAQQLSGLFPALSWDVLATNVANVGGNARYVWRTISGNETVDITNERIADQLIRFGVTTFALQLEGRTNAALRDYNGAQAERLGAIASYQSAMRSANTGEQNAYDSNATSKANADASADTAKANTDASADTSKGNTDRTASIARVNAGRENDFRTIAEQNSRNYTTNTTSIDLAVMQASTISAVQQETIATMTQVNNIVAGTAGSVAMHAIAGDAPGAILSGAMGAAGALNAGASYAMTVSTDLTLASVTQQAAYEKSAEAVSLAYTNKENANSQNAEITDRNATLAENNAKDTRDTTKANATRSQNTTKANAARSQATGNSNAGYSRGTTEQNAKQNLEVARQKYLSRIANGSVDTPTQYGTFSGDGVPDALRRKGIHMRVITQSKAAVARAGDAFLRYGYRFEGLWDVNGSMNFAGHRYAYWQSADVMLDAQGLPCDAERTARDILTAGVTVWANPDDVEVWA